LDYFEQAVVGLVNTALIGIEPGIVVEPVKPRSPAACSHSAAYALLFHHKALKLCVTAVFYSDNLP